MATQNIFHTKIFKNMFGFNYSKSSHASFIPCPLYHNLFIDNKIQNTYTVWPRFISSMPALATWTSLEPLVWSSVSTFFPLLSTQLPARFFEKINLIRSLCGSKSSLSPSVLKMAYKPHPTPHHFSDFLSCSLHFSVYYNHTGLLVPRLHYHLRAFAQAFAQM